VIETGVAAGVSSTYILYAMENSGIEGNLISIDAGKREFDGIRLPQDKPVGFLVPYHLRKRWKLIIGLSRSILPHILEELGNIDVFLHDSEHTYENMMFEYTTVWPHLKPGRVIISDNIEWNSAFRDFCAKARAANSTFYGIGIAVK
jgi:predicted O-methyltransferase YrrM